VSNIRQPAASFAVLSLFSALLFLCSQPTKSLATLCRKASTAIVFPSFKTRARLASAVPFFSAEYPPPLMFSFAALCGKGFYANVFLWNI
jgi:hypothetical protein